MFIILSGVQGSGKGTQGRILEEKFGFKIFETGWELRKHIAANSEIWKKVKAVIDAGQLVWVEIIEEIVKEFIESLKPDDNVIFDGIPRNKVQKEFMDKIFNKFDYKVLSLDLPKEKVEARLLGRRTCNNCKKVFPSVYEGDKCDNCETWVLVRRDDDQDEQAIKTRINIFFDETLPVIKMYEQEWKLVEVNADNSIEWVTEDIISKLNLK